MCARAHGWVRACVGLDGWARACSLNYPAYNAPPYCHLWPLWLHHNFRHYLINGTIFGKKLLNIKCVFWVSLQLLFETFLILRRIQRDIVIMWKHLQVKYPLFLSDFNEAQIFVTDFRKSLKYQISSNSVEWEPSSVRSDGRTKGRVDRLDETDCRFSQLCERT